VAATLARRHDVHPNLLHHWRRRAKQAVSFVPVTVSPEERASVGGVIEIELGSGIRVRVDARVDEAALSRVLRALAR
jgi:transposase-like protein